MYRKPTILILIDYYLPGYKGGGPAKSVKNITEYLETDYNFKIITSDRDLGDDKPYDSIMIDEWIQFENVEIYYASPKSLRFFALVELINNSKYDLLYINSFFQPAFAIQPLIASFLKLLKNNNVLITPRGELEPGCLNIKPLKKKTYIFATKLVNFYKNLKWHATNKQEREWVKDVLEVSDDKIYVASNLTPLLRKDSEKSGRIFKTDTSVKICFISRITREKNLDYALRIINQVESPVTFNIYGTNDQDREYWQECKKLIVEMNEKHTINYLGQLNPNDVVPTFRNHDLFLFPTHGENFAHVIFESMSAGTPVLITDTTPWRHLSEKGAGWDYPIEDTESFVKQIEYLSTLNDMEFKKIRKSTFDFAYTFARDSERINLTKMMFKNCIEN